MSDTHQADVTLHQRTSRPSRIRARALYTVFPDKPGEEGGRVALSWQWEASSQMSSSYLARPATTAPFRLRWSTLNSTVSPTPTDEVWDIVLPLHTGVHDSDTYRVLESSLSQRREIWNADMAASTIFVQSAEDCCPEYLTVLKSEPDKPPRGHYDLHLIRFEVLDILEKDPRLDGCSIDPQIWLIPDPEETVRTDGTRIGTGEVSVWRYSSPVSAGKDAV